MQRLYRTKRQPPTPPLADPHDAVDARPASSWARPHTCRPEQAKGKPVDRRADIWAFGVVLMEMLTGRPLYTGETVSEILAAVIRDQPEYWPLARRNPGSDPQPGATLFG